MRRLDLVGTMTEGGDEVATEAGLYGLAGIGIDDDKMGGSGLVMIRSLDELGLTEVVVTEGDLSEKLGAKITDGEEESTFCGMDELVWLFWVKSGLGCDGFGPTIEVDDDNKLGYATLARGRTNSD